MTYINNKSNYFPNVVTREEQSEITQQTSAEQPQVNTGIANTTDIFESARPSDLIQQQTFTSDER